MSRYVPIANAHRQALFSDAVVCTDCGALVLGDIRFIQPNRRIGGVELSPIEIHEKWHEQQQRTPQYNPDNGCWE